MEFKRGLNQRDPVVVALDPGVVARPAHRVRHPAVPVPVLPLLGTGWDKNLGRL